MFSFTSALALLFMSPVMHAMDWWKPSKGLTFQWQLDGEIDSDIPADVFDIDLFDASEDTIELLHFKGIKVICYFSGGSWEEWRDDADQFPQEAIGGTNGWPGERWVDVNHEEVRHIMKNRIELAAEKGCDGVEPDNVDVYTLRSRKSGVDVSAEDQLSYNIFLAEEAHYHGLAIALKNDIEQLNELHWHFDFAVNEECYQWEECEAYEDTFLADDKPVFNTEYEFTNLGATGDAPAFCEYMNTVGISSILKEYDLKSELCSCADEVVGGELIGKECKSLLQSQHA